MESSQRRREKRKNEKWPRLLLISLVRKQFDVVFRLLPISACQATMKTVSLGSWICIAWLVTHSCYDSSTGGCHLLVRFRNS